MLFSLKVPQGKRASLNADQGKPYLHNYVVFVEICSANRIVH